MCLTLVKIMRRFCLNRCFKGWFFIRVKIFPFSQFSYFIFFFRTLSLTIFNHHLSNFSLSLSLSLSLILSLSLSLALSFCLCLFFYPYLSLFLSLLSLSLFLDLHCCSIICITYSLHNYIYELSWGREKEGFVASQCRV